MIRNMRQDELRNLSSPSNQPNTNPNTQSSLPHNYRYQQRLNNIQSITDNIGIAYQNEKEDNITFTIWEKNKFKQINTFENYRQTKISDIVEYIFQKRIEKLINERNASRNEKNYQKSDQIRDELKSLGIEIEDTPDGTIWRKS